MRDLPRAARIAIATLYIRYREARRRTNKLARKYGCCHNVTRTVRDTRNIIWNDLQAVLHDIRQYNSNQGSTKDFIKSIGKRNRIAL